MATADAKLLPPPPFPSAPDSDRNLASVGPLAVLGAMVQQKNRASRPPLEEIEPLHASLDTENDDIGDGDGNGDANATRPRKVPQYSDAFIKVR